MSVWDEIRHRGYLIHPVYKGFYAYEPNSHVSIVGHYKSVASAKKAIDKHIVGGNAALAKRKKL
jgi:hypothetical protein